MVFGRVRAIRDRLLAQLAPDTGCPLGWDPSVFTPVFYGHRDHQLQLAPEQVVATDIAFMAGSEETPGQVMGPESSRSEVDSQAGTGPTMAVGGSASQPMFPGTMEVECRVFYPSLDGSPPDAPILRGCARSPLIVFSHGQCEGLVPTDYYRQWHEIPVTLARAGYVVLVPRYHSPSLHADDDVERMRRLVRWIRGEGSGYSDLLLPAPHTGLAGHSYGAAISAMALAGNHVSARAFAAVSGSEVPAVDESLPRLLTWGTADGDVQSAGPDNFTEIWRPAASMNVAVFEGASHFDYVPCHRIPCGEPKHAESPLVPYLAADVVTLFFARYLPSERRLPSRWGGLLRPRVSGLLEPPHWPRTTEQAFYAGGMFSAWNSLDTGGYDPVHLHHHVGGRWKSKTRG